MMRARALFSLVGALIAAVALVSASGAATTKAQKIARIDVSTRAAVVHYLRSIGVNPRGAVIERGARNYAGAHCPGTRWTCASTRHTVVQIARRGGQNRFLCRSSRCVVVQLSGVSDGIYTVRRQLTSTSAPNKGGGGSAATCINPTTGTCTINQSGAGPNLAIVYQNVGKKSGLTQNVTYSASITQSTTGATAGNTACVSQVMSLDATTSANKGSVAVNIDGHQSVTIMQDVTGSGANSAQNAATSSGTCDTSHPLAQTQTLTSQADAPSGVTQNENATHAACPDGNVTADYANMCLDIEQNQGAGHTVASGTNNATFAQTNTLSAIADSKAGPITQTQSTLNGGGLLGTVNQDSSGVSTASATQTETQCEDGAKGGLGNTCHTSDPDASEAPSSLTQNQYGPVGVGKFRKNHRGRVLYSVHKGLGTATQSGNSHDTFTINQTSTQNTDQGSGSNQTNTVQGDCITPGTCTVTQTVTVNGTPTTNTQTGQNVSTSINCTSSTTCTAPAPGITFDGSPGTGSPPSTLGPYTMTAFGPDSQPVCPNDGSSVTGVTDPAGAITFDEALRHDHVGVVGCWSTWSHGYTGDVYDTVNSVALTQVTITLPVGTNAFYFYAEPNQFQLLTVQATAQNGTTSGQVDVQGDSGAQYFGFYGTGGDTVQSITISTSDSTGFAVGEFGINTSQIIG